MILGENIGSVYNKGKEIQRVYSRGRLVWEKETIDYNITPFTVRAVDDNVSVKLSNSFKYSKNGEDWFNVDDTYSITLRQNEEVNIIGTNISNCKITGLSDICGNIMSLIYGEDYTEQTTLNNRLYGFFQYSDIRNANNLILPATTLVEECYWNMFYYCSSLITAPELPATKLTYGCYQQMFCGCSSLIKAPELPATTLAGECYFGMFSECSSLTTAPKLPATTLAYRCYRQMFNECTSLTTAPELPATTMENACYASMFYGCSILRTAPKLPSTDLAISCYSQMFALCISLTTAPELPAPIVCSNCYKQMFSHCDLLDYVKCYATQTTNTWRNSVENWLGSITTNGTLVCKQVDGGKNPLENYIPSTWTVEYFT